MPSLPYISSTFPPGIIWMREFSFTLPFCSLQTPWTTLRDCMVTPSLGPGPGSLPFTILVHSDWLRGFVLKERTHGANPLPREGLSQNRKWTKDWWLEPSSGKYFHCLPTEGMAERVYLLSREICITWPSAFHSCWKFNPLHILMMV